MQYILFYAITSLVVIPEFCIFMEQEAIFASSTSQFTGLNFVLPHTARNIFSALERTAQVTLNENAMHNENLQLIFLWVSYYHPQNNYFLHR